ncbi:MAG: hypothetical protein IMF17_01485 [Proteobacteria bacterium]|nr:hypothetical protein [Pseudomonadota bacterium]
MKEVLLQEKYPVYYLEIDKADTSFTNVDDIIAYLKAKVEDHKAAKYIAEFDHYAHTKGLEQGEISDDIIAAKNLVFCFGITLPNPQVMAVRPRSIGICDMKDRFVIDFLEAPIQLANDTMEQWVKSIANQLEVAA